MGREKRPATPAELEEVRRAYTAAARAYESASFLASFDLPNESEPRPPVFNARWEDLYAELTAAPGDPHARSVSETVDRAPGSPSTRYSSRVVAQAVRLWTDGRLNQSGIAGETDLPRTAVRRIARLVDTGGLWLDPRGRLLLGNGSDFRAADETLSLRE